MGSPDLPNNENDRRRQFQPPPSHELPMHGLDAADMHPDNQNSDDDTNDVDMAATQRPVDQTATDATDDVENPYVADGYHPLNFEPMSFGDDEEGDEDGSDDDDEGWTKAVDDGDDDFETVVPEAEDEPPRNTVDRDILRQVWNQPRPAELDIDIDATKAEEIKSAMSSVSLNLAGIKPPEWATVVPESRWIEELLQKVRTAPLDE